MAKPYNTNPSLPLQEAFRIANECALATRNMRYVAGSFRHMHPTLNNDDKAITRAFNAVHRATYLALDALHHDDLEAAQSAATDAQNARQEAEAILRSMFEAFMKDIQQSQEGEYKLRSEHGTVGTFGAISVDPAVGDEEEFVYLTMNYPGDPTFDVQF
jgi:hypothetical protein